MGQLQYTRYIMKNLKTGITLIILGNLLNLAYIYFGKNGASDFSDFTNGVLLGLSIGCNLIGIVLTVAFVSKSK